MKTAFRITRNLLAAIYSDLSRPHPFAAERVGFISCAVGDLPGHGLVLLAQDFHPVADRDYVDNPTVGAMMGSAAIRSALQLAYNQQVSMFHVHRHEHDGRPWFSRVDLRESARFVPDFWKVRPGFPHGAIVLSHDSMAGLCWDPQKGSPSPISEMSVVGQHLSTIREKA